MENGRATPTAGNLRALGASGIQISAVIMGTWQAGKDRWTDIDDRVSVDAIRAAFDAGVTTFDTAEAYGKGHSERILGQALADVRDRVVLATKVFPHNLAHERLIAACHRSLRNLRTDVIDLYQIHWPAGAHGSRRVPIAETMDALNRLQAEGKIRAIGVSNFSRHQLAEARRCGRIDSLQPPYSLFWRHAETGAIPYCRKHQITVLAYSPMAQGLLTGKFGPQHRFAPGDHRAHNKLMQPENFARVQQALSRLRPIAARRQVSLACLALAWILAHPQTCAIAGARNPRQSKENASAMAIRLESDDLAQMDAVSREVTDHLGEDPVMWDF